MAGEIDLLLQALTNIKEERNNITNSKDVWSKIGQKDWAGAGFRSQEEAEKWLESNPYSNL